MNLDELEAGDYGAVQPTIRALIARIRELEQTSPALEASTRSLIKRSEQWQTRAEAAEARIRAADRLAEIGLMARDVIDSLVGIADEVAEMAPAMVPMLNYADTVKARISAALAAYN